ncbi:MAG: helix-turn-helix domain-containing protein [Chthoniobacter sp.]|nr:helix-turn-helix domain-containing protein [Chthoniobacter sp.]
MNEPQQLLDQLARSEIYRDYERSFSEATGMPLALRRVESWDLAHRGKRRENPFCAMLAASSPACAACLDAQKRIADPAARGPQSVVCFAGLSEASVPVRCGAQLLGFLQTGEVIVGRPTRTQFAKTVKTLRARGSKVDRRKLELAYFQTKALTPKQYASVLRLLAIFAGHLGLVANQLALRSRHAEPESMGKARQFIREHQTEQLALADVARAASMSTFYFCKTFKKATGLTFTNYLSRARIEKARELLGNPQARVSEVAYEVGFQSLTHFNRTFQRVLGESPTAYRAALPK